MIELDNLVLEKIKTLVTEALQRNSIDNNAAEYAKQYLISNCADGSREQYNNLSLEQIEKISIAYLASRNILKKIDECQIQI